VDAAAAQTTAPEMTLDDLFERAAQAVDGQRGNYFWEPIPVPLDGVLYDLLSAFAQADAPSRRRLVERLTERQRTHLTSFSVRLASMAVRGHDPELIVLGLVAQWLGWPGVEDVRERVMRLAPMYHAAVKLEASPVDVFDRAARIVGDEEFRRSIRAWLGRPENKKTLRSLGYREVTGRDGFRFEPGGSGW
jgi:hypothetical protein